MREGPVVSSTRRSLQVQYGHSTGVAHHRFGCVGAGPSQWCRHWFIQLHQRATSPAQLDVAWDWCRQGCKGN